MKTLWRIIIRFVVGFILAFIFLLLFGIVGVLLGGNNYLGSFEFAGLPGYEGGGVFFGIIGSATGAALGVFAVDFYERKPNVRPFVGSFSILLWMIFLGFVVPEIMDILVWQNSLGLFFPLIGAVIGSTLKK